MAPVIYLIHPGANWSTHDVYVGMKAGFEACGCTVRPYLLNESLDFYAKLFDAAEAGGLVWDSGARPNLHGFASLKAANEVAYEQPDAVVAVSGHNLHAVVPETARRVGVPAAVYCTESPYFGDFEHQFGRHYDAVFTNERLSVASFEAAYAGLGRRPVVRYLAHAYNPEVHTPGPPEPGYDADVFFVGSGFKERRLLFRGVDWEGIKFVTHGFLWDDNENPNALDVSKVLPNSEAARFYRTARISLNHHRTTTVVAAGAHISALEAASLGPRAYEIAACGGFQLMDDSRPEAFEVFGDSLATYKSHSPLDLERRIRWWLGHPDERERRAAAQREAVAPHSWASRAREVLEVVLNLPRRKAAA